ncbi:hypothetical protein KPL71_004641 [Citrus sinensis]|uniref:Uncharacterized protein n=1 Tax=Citrus sinensis TaxID=2711 RepID=A0ACB8N8M6_CITSI|nr:hypothetical protein KPL71_004641 [Citrus sinensis]
MMILLGCMDLDLSFRHPKPDELTDGSTSEDVLYYEKWDRSNRMSLMIMKRSVPEHNLISSKSVTTVIKEKWNLKELISFCVQEEERLKQEKTEYAHVVSTSKDKGKRKKKGEAAASKGPEPKKPKAEHGCFFCGKPGHVKKECKKYHAWRVKKDTFLTLGCLSYRPPSDAERCIYVGDGKTPKLSYNSTKKIKNVRSNRGDEYYGRYDGSGEQRLGSFAKYLEEYGIVPQYTMPGSPSMNGVSERRNRTLKDMVRKRSRGFKFYDPSTMSIFEMETATFFKDVEFGGRNPVRNIVFEEEEGSTVAFDNVQVLIPVIDHEVNSDPQPFDNVVQPQNQHEMIVPKEQTQQPQELVQLRRSIRERRNAIPDDYIVFLQEHEDETEYKSMQDNKVWELISLPSGAKPIGCKWIFKTNRDSNGNVERYKARLVAKGFTQKEGIDYKETFSPVSTKDSFRTIIALVAHFDFELHQMDVKTAFLNGDIEETIYMVQPENFVLGDPKKMVCKLTQSIYGLKQASRQCKPGDTHVAKGDKFSLSQCPKTNLEIKEMVKIPYSPAIWSLIYLNNPGMDNWKAAKRVMRYLQRTNEYMLTYKRSDQLEIIGYSDSDFAGCQDSRRSTSGYIYMLAGGAISWRSAKQTLVASSTMAAKFVACYEASNQGIWLRNFVTGLRILEGVERPLKIFCDNKSAVLYSNNNRSSTKSKHIEIKFLVVKERVQSGQISIEHIGTNSMIADLLTKGLPSKVFHGHTAHMGVILLKDIQI